ncbi:hypothetical protein A2592_02425 [Candidatus Kaiserbacteria bacterium RIFOXYD1_FULL_42_15]|uniref:Uncharacterized protein n=1 Tax=Candidatus Kaiserbacteria bacterium RIFOXYD1_FULL_42_15 TaxID=1798532 RepID=A0A1F6FPM7_9BACT|nr:MAG: hypothetical protein A2592_02425 [Candidatus Kaiserbacteria bacterium RIFOXYD1_FULL_42_15]
MEKKVVGLEILKFNFFGLKWNQADHLVLMVFDSTSHTFAVFGQRQLDRGMEGIWFGNPKARAKKILKNFSPSKGQILSVAYQGSVALKCQRRHYVLVEMDYCSFSPQTGYKTLNPRADLVAALGEINAKNIAKILAKKFPDLFQIAA